MDLGYPRRMSVRGSPFQRLSAPQRPAGSWLRSPQDLPVAVAIPLAAVVGGGLASIKWALPLVLIAVALLVVYGWRRPAGFLTLLLLVRPLLDSLSTHHVSGGFVQLNVAGAIGLVILAVVGGFLLLQRDIELPPGSGTFAAVIGYGALSLILTFENFGGKALTTGISEALRLSAMLAVFVLAANVVRTPQHVRRLFRLAVASALIPAAVAVIQYVSGNATVETGLVIPRAFSTFYGPNPLGEYCALIAMILVSSPSDFLSRRIRLTALVIVIAALVMTFSRAGWVMLIVGLIAIESRRVPRRLVSAGVVIVLLLVAFPSVRDRVLPTGTTAAQDAGNSLSNGSLLSASGTYGSLGWRLNNWKGLIVKAEQSPLVGFGLETTQDANALRESSLYGLPTLGFDAHNSAVRAVVEGGLIGLVLWVALCAALVRRSAGMMRDSWPLAPYARIIWGFWVSIVVIGVTSDDPFAGTALMYVAFALTGGLLATYRRRVLLEPAAEATVISETTDQVVAHT
jgi:O-antigen ligase